MYVCMYVYFGQFKMVALEVYALQGSQSSMFAFRRLSIKRNWDIGMCLYGNTSKKLIERVSCEIKFQMSRRPSDGHLKMAAL